MNLLCLGRLRTSTPQYDIIVLLLLLILGILEKCEAVASTMDLLRAYWHRINEYLETSCHL